MSVEILVPRRQHPVPPAWELPVAVVLAVAALVGTSIVLSNDYSETTLAIGIAFAVIVVTAAGTRRSAGRRPVPPTVILASPSELRIRAQGGAELEVRRPDVTGIVRRGRTITFMTATKYNAGIVDLGAEPDAALAQLVALGWPAPAPR